MKIVLLILLHYTFTGATDGIVTLPGSTVCNETVKLGKVRHAVIIDFRVSTFSLDPVNHFCSFHVETINTPYVGMKFLSVSKDNGHSFLEQCSFELNITGKKMEQFHYNHFPEREITVDTYGYITVKLKLVNCTVQSNGSTIFQLLVFKFGDVFCFSGETKCVNSTRCVNGNLTCTDLYDFCGNDFENCKRVPENDIHVFKRTGPPSIPGILLGSICLTILVTFLLYIIACRKQPCFHEMMQKLLCRSSFCRSLDNRGDDTIAVSVAFSNETQDISLNSCSREPPPNYFDIYLNNLGQTENGNVLSETGGAFQYGGQDIPPPFYSEDAGAAEINLHELPPPYSLETTNINNSNVQHI